MKRTSASRIIAVFGLLLAVATAACSTPTGPATLANGSRAVITNPAGGGPQIIRWGPPTSGGTGYAG